MRSLIEQAMSEALRQMAAETGTESMEEVRVVVERPANPQHGEYSVNTAMQLAKKLRKSPLAIADDICRRLAVQPAVGALFKRVEAVAPGFVNFHADWGKWASAGGGALRAADHGRTGPFREETGIPSDRPDTGRASNSLGSFASKPPKVLIEHTSINPNKSAHIGHLRNSCIGDTIARLMRAAGYRVEVHNYIDDLGNQLADTLVSLRYNPAGKDISKDYDQAQGNVRFGDFCWDTYAMINRAYKLNPELQSERVAVLHELESGAGGTAWLGLLVAERIVREHVEEMRQFGIGYDVLVWESSMVRGGFWERTFELLRTTPVFRLETEGKLAGCWVLQMTDDKPDTLSAGEREEPSSGEKERLSFMGREELSAGETEAGARLANAAGETESGAETADAAGENETAYEADKVLVRSNGVLTYTAKDIAYHLWKFGLLDVDFRYRSFAPRLWSTDRRGVAKKGIGCADWVINVIDHRQHYPQTVVRQALAALGFEAQAERLRHVGYGVVSLSPGTAGQLGVDVSAGKAAYPMSGRQGIGIRIAELLDRMEQAIDGKRSRKAGLSSRDIAAASIRYYLLRYHLHTEIVFDLDQAMETTGNTGVYLLYSYARACSLLDKGAQSGAGWAQGELCFAAPTPQEQGLLRQLAYWPDALAAAVSELAPNVLCGYAYELTTLFNHFYAACPILKAEGAARAERLWLTERFRDTLGEALRLLGLPTPERM